MNSELRQKYLRITIYDLRFICILLLFIIHYSLFISHGFSQGIGINSSGAPADNSALLDVSANGKGLLIPRMTTAGRPANPVESIIIYNTDTQCFEAYNAATTKWVNLACIGAGWKCGNNLVDSRDSKSYKTVMIGTQCWLMQNLNIGSFVQSFYTNGDAHTNVSDNGIIEKYCYNNDTVNCAIYGGLYEWSEMMGYVSSEGVRGICQEGWHIPSDAEWTTLTNFLGGESVAGGKMKTTGTKEAGTGLWYSPNAGATDESGFSALPAGLRNYNGNFYDIGSYCDWWTSTENSTNLAWYRQINTNNPGVYRYYGYYGKTFGFSVRCVKDN